MGRSVSVPSDAVQVAYAVFPAIEEYEGEERETDCDDFDMAVEALQYHAKKMYPSLRTVDRWLGDEDHVILENAFAVITVSEYCNLVAVAVVPLYGERVSSEALAEHWCSQVKVEELVTNFGERMISQGRFSNGEQIFAPADGDNKGELGLGFTSKEGWL